MKRIVITSIAALFLLVVAAIVLFQAQIGLATFNRAVEQNTGRDALASLEDGLHLGLCGTGSPLPNPDRAGPCNVVIAGDQAFIVDIGEGGGRNVALMGINAADLDGVLLTHFHSDHIDGLGPLMLFRWTRGASTTPLPVHGPDGVEAITAGFNAAYATDNTYRIAHHGETIVPPSGGGVAAFPFEMTDSSTTVMERGELKITAFKVDHSPIDPAVGYRFDYKGRSLCVSGDTAKSANLEKACEGVDLLVHDALQPIMVGEMQAAQEAQGDNNAAKIMFDIQDYHASPQDAAESAQAVRAKTLVLSHLVPPLPSAFLYPAFLGDAADHFDGDLVVGEDGMLFSLPPESETINRSRLM